MSDDSRRRTGQSSLAEQLGSINAAATQLGTTWPSLRKAFTRHGLGTPAPNPEAVRQRTIAATRQRSGQPATPSLDPVFVALNPGALPARPRSPAELHEWVRREEQYATLGANVVVELYSESRARRPTSRAWAIIRRADRAHRLAGQRASRTDRRHADRADRPSRSQQPRSGRWRPMLADPTGPTSAQRAVVLHLLSSLMSPGSWPKAPLGYESFEYHYAGVLTRPEISSYTGGLGRFPPEAVPPCSWPYRLAS